jgi:hypothetical protein
MRPVRFVRPILAPLAALPGTFSRSLETARRARSVAPRSRPEFPGCAAALAFRAIPGGTALARLPGAALRSRSWRTALAAFRTGTFEPRTARAFIEALLASTLLPSLAGAEWWLSRARAPVPGALLETRFAFAIRRALAAAERPLLFAPAGIVDARPELRFAFSIRRTLTAAERWPLPAPGIVAARTELRFALAV